MFKLLNGTNRVYLLSIFFLCIYQELIVVPKLQIKRRTLMDRRKIDMNIEKYEDRLRSQVGASTGALIQEEQPT